MSELIHDWNGGPPLKAVPAVTDETLRDGVQSPSVRNPDTDTKIKMLHLAVELGVQRVDIGLPGAGANAFEACAVIAREIADEHLPIVPNCAARTLESDIEPVARLEDKAGIEIEASCFLGSSPIRLFVEGWTKERLLELTRDAVRYAAKLQVPVMFVTEDTTRARPEDLADIYGAALDEGARRICLADTVGHATATGTRALVAYMLDVLAGRGDALDIDWHGHDDRGLALANSLAALEAGATGVHGTILGVGERSGNAPLDLVLVNLSLLGAWEKPLAPLMDYCSLVSSAMGVEIPYNYPAFGRDAFRTATGVHAAAVIKAQRKGDRALADSVYSSVPASVVGRKQEIEIGPMSGRSNVAFWLESRNIKFEEGDVETIMSAAKQSDHTLTEEEIMHILRR